MCHVVDSGYVDITLALVALIRSPTTFGEIVNAVEGILTASAVSPRSAMSLVNEHSFINFVSNLKILKANQNSKPLR